MERSLVNSHKLVCGPCNELLPPPAYRWLPVAEAGRTGACFFELFLLIFNNNIRSTHQSELRICHLDTTVTGRNGDQPGRNNCINFRSLSDLPKIRTRAGLPLTILRSPNRGSLVNNQSTYSPPAGTRAALSASTFGLVTCNE